MKYIKTLNQFFEVEKINEEWVPYDIFFVPKNKSKSDSYLEFEGNYLKEISGGNRNLKILLNQIKNICENPISVNDIFDAHVWVKKDKKSETTITRKVNGFIVQKQKGEKKLIMNALSELGETSIIEFWGPNIKVDLHNPIELTFTVKYAF